MAGQAPEDIKLTEKQQAMIDALMKNPISEETVEEIALRIGTSRANLYNTFKAVLKKLGVKEMKRRFDNVRIHKMVDYQLERNPGKVNTKSQAERNRDAQEIKQKARQAYNAEPATAVLLKPKAYGVDVSDLDSEEAFEKLLRMAELAGVPKLVVDSLATRIRRGMDEGDFMPVDYKDEDLYNELRQKIRLVISHIDHVTVGGAKLAELSTMFKTIMEQLQLLEGRPTAILGVADQENMADIAARFNAEFARRQGRTIDVEPQDEDH